VYDAQTWISLSLINGEASDGNEANFFFYFFSIFLSLSLSFAKFSSNYSPGGGKETGNSSRVIANATDSAIAIAFSASLHVAHPGEKVSSSPGGAGLLPGIFTNSGPRRSQCRRRSSSDVVVAAEPRVPRCRIAMLVSVSPRASTEWTRSPPADGQTDERPPGVSSGLRLIRNPDYPRVPQPALSYRRAASAAKDAPLLPLLLSLLPRCALLAPPRH